MNETRIGEEANKSLQLTVAPVTCAARTHRPRRAGYAALVVLLAAVAVVLGWRERVASARKDAAERAQQRLTLYRTGRGPRILKDQRVIIVDDGLATAFAA